MTSDEPSNDNEEGPETYVSLCLYGDDLDPGVISETLGLTPSSAARKGETRVSPRGKTHRAPTGRWILESDGQVASACTEEHLAWLLDRIEAAGVRPARLPNVQRASVSCFWFSPDGQRGPEFSVEVLRRLVAAELPLELHFYGGAGAPP